MKKMKTVTLDDVRKRRPVDEAEVARIRHEILSESRANRLADLRRGVSLTQEQIAERIGVDQPRVSRIERGDLARTEVGSLAAYAEAMGGTLELRVQVGGKSYPLPVGSGTSRSPRKAPAAVTAKRTAKKPAQKVAATTRTPRRKKLAG